MTSGKNKWKTDLHGIEAVGNYPRAFDGERFRTNAKVRGHPLLRDAVLTANLATLRSDQIMLVMEVHDDIGVQEFNNLKSALRNGTRIQIEGMITTTSHQKYSAIMRVENLEVLP